MALDLYSEWLDVPPGPRRPDHYTLLGLPLFCNDASAIENAARARLKQLDQYALHPDSALRDACQRLMNEVARARIVLVTNTRKARYDAELAAGETPISNQIQLEPDEVAYVEDDAETTREPEAYLFDMARAAEVNSAQRAVRPRIGRRAWGPTRILTLFMALFLFGGVFWFVVSSGVRPAEKRLPTYNSNPVAPSVAFNQTPPIAPKTEPFAQSQPTLQDLPRMQPPKDSEGAKRVVFICDVSDSTSRDLANLKLEMIRTIEQMPRLEIPRPGLPPHKHLFSILAFGGDHVQAWRPGRWMPVSPETCASASEFVQSLATSGWDDPVPALRYAVGQHPDLLYLVTSGDFSDPNGVASLLRQINTGHQTKVNCIHFSSGNSSDAVVRERLLAIARENGGVYKFVKVGVD